MRKNKIVLKKLVVIFFILLMSLKSFSAIVSDNDGSAFITKAEFEAFKNNFQTQVDKYNTNINNKIDGAIASYLAGIKLTVNNKYRTIFGDKTTNPFYIYKDAKSALVPFYYSDAGLDILCAMSWGRESTYATVVGLSLNYEGEPVTGVLYGSWSGSKTAKINHTYYASIIPTLKFEYSANGGGYCGGTWGLNNGYLKTEWTNNSYRAGSSGDANIQVNGSKTDKHIYSGNWHFGSDDANKSTNVLSWADIPSWGSAYTFCGGSGHSSNSVSDWKFLKSVTNKTSFAVATSSALVPFINTSRSESAYIRVQDRIKTAPSKSYISKAAYNMTKSVTGDTSTNTTYKDRPRDPLWCRFSYWPRKSFNNNAAWNALSSDTDRKNSAVIPVSCLNSETLINNFDIDGEKYTIKIWSGCPLYKIDDASSDCKFDVTLDKMWNAGGTVRFKLYIQTSKEGFTKQQLGSGYTEPYLVDGVENSGKNWISSGKHTIKLTRGADENDLIWLTWRTDIDGDGGKLTACSEVADCTSLN